MARNIRWKREQVLECALTITLLRGGIAFAEEEVLNGVVIGATTLSDFGLRLIVEHLTDEVTALRQGAQTQIALGTIRVFFQVGLVKLHQ